MPLGRCVCAIGCPTPALTAASLLPPRCPQFTFKLLPGQVPLKLVQTITMGPAQGVRVTVHRRA